ncbi:MAG: nucleotidyltransferase family protein [Deltaproteobacteria bacterium]|nr:nucleotidyltransferase family protein [Deltaproteobacteria bacterium]
MKRTREEIFRLIEAHSATIRNFGVRHLSLFGSCVRGETTDSSDLDFVVEFEKKSFDAYMDLKAFLDDLFNCPVDLVLANAIKPRLRPLILGEAVHAPGL